MSIFDIDDELTRSPDLKKRLGHRVGSFDKNLFTEQSTDIDGSFNDRWQSIINKHGLICKNEEDGTVGVYVNNTCF